MKNSWARVFPPVRPMLAGLTSAFLSIIVNSETNGAERDTYADFLDEASVILNKPALADVGQEFRACAAAWEVLGRALLPDEIEPFGQIRRLMLRRRALFFEQGGAASAEIIEINRQIAALKSAVASDFPLSAAELHPFLEQLAGNIMSVHDLEKSAVQNLQAVMLK